MRNQIRVRLGSAKPSIWAAITLAAALSATSAIAIANAGSAHHDKAKSCSSSGACFQETNTGSGTGVEGSSTNGAGILGSSVAYYGVLGKSSGLNAAVGGFNTDAGQGASGMYGQSDNGPGVTGFSTTDYAIVAEGNAYVSGEIYTGGACSQGCSKTRQMVSYVPRASQPTIDDVGESTLRNGFARVSLASDFAGAIDSSKPYVVLLTPEGEASLYVTNRTPAGFDVRQIGAGRSSVPFAYRIVAKPFAVADGRLSIKAVKDYAALARGR